MKAVALVTGANRGLGLETCRKLAADGHDVVLSARDLKKGKAAAEELRKHNLTVDVVQLDVQSTESISRAIEDVLSRKGRIDILINNAGILVEGRGTKRFPSVFNVGIEKIREAMEVNALGPLMVSRAVIPQMKARNFGRIVNVSSGMGQLTYMNGGYPAYRVSKASLNAVTRILTDELKGTNIQINSVCPGWVRTDMGGPDAPLSVEEGTDTIIWLATRPDGFKSGAFFRSREEIPF